ncbi:maleylpyruvate isomerase family mycothiol-dependent enzyme [Actinomadura yumaensis]|uniref:Maleylpyruvate isomerase family mycothiol-dependent enzyme n=1 Tax=Actinomadura yumaensis TaxID=111807 RepID=A0ABW2CSB8_9ACTN
MDKDVSMDMNRDVDTAPTPERLAEGLREQTAAFAAHVDGGDPDARVPTCPEWTLRDLVAHVGRAHRWAAELVRTRSQEVAGGPSRVPVDGSEPWRDWLLEGADLLVAAAEEAGPDATLWSFVGPQPPAFWLRRMLNDTSVHQADAAATTGGAFTIAPDLAADAIDEALLMLSGPWAEKARPQLARLRGEGQTLGWRATGAPPAAWLVTRTPDGVTSRRSSAEGDVNVSASLADLLRVLSRRLPPDDPAVTVTGDRPLLDHWLSHTAF